MEDAIVTAITQLVEKVGVPGALLFGLLWLVIKSQPKVFELVDRFVTAVEAGVGIQHDMGETMKGIGEDVKEIRKNTLSAVPDHR